MHSSSSKQLFTKSQSKIPKIRRKKTQTYLKSKPFVYTSEQQTSLNDTHTSYMHTKLRTPKCRGMRGYKENQSANIMPSSIHNGRFSKQVRVKSSKPTPLPNRTQYLPQIGSKRKSDHGSASKRKIRVPRLPRVAHISTTQEPGRRLDRPTAESAATSPVKSRLQAQNSVTSLKSQKSIRTKPYKTISPGKGNYETRPIKISWMLNEKDQTMLEMRPQEGGKGDWESLKGKFGLIYCPGKTKEKKGKDHRSNVRDIDYDIQQLANDETRIGMIVCLICDYELRAVGVDPNQYRAACERNGVELVQYPIVEMAAPKDSIPEFDSKLIQKIINHMQGVRSETDTTGSTGDSEMVEEVKSDPTMRPNVVIHCRFGVGRAGTVAGCLYSRLTKFTSAKKIIDHVRVRRCKRAIEGRKQEEFIKDYHKYYK